MNKCLYFSIATRAFIIVYCFDLSPPDLSKMKYLIYVSSRIPIEARNYKGFMNTFTGGEIRLHMDSFWVRNGREG